MCNFCFGRQAAAVAKGRDRKLVAKWAELNSQSFELQAPAVEGMDDPPPYQDCQNPYGATTWRFRLYI